MNPTRGSIAALFVLCLAIPCRAQTPPPPANSSGIQFSGSLRFRSETWSWFDTPAANPDYTFFANLLRFSLSQRKEKWDWQAEFAQPLLVNLPARSIAPAPQGQLGLGASYFAANNDTAPAGLFLKQGFVRFKNILGDKSGSFRIGRFEFIDGTEAMPRSPTIAALVRDRIAHRLVGNFAFSHVGRSFDGLQYTHATKTTNVTFVAARVTQGVFQVNGWGELDTDILYASVTRPVGKKSPGEWRVFALSYHDGRPLLKTDNRPAILRAADHHNIRITTLGGDYLQTFKIGNSTVDTLAWGAGQFGHWGLLDHRAGAIALEGGVQPDWKFKPWIRAGYFWGSGDQNPTDGNHGTFFQVLPTPRIYARFPFYNLMNNQDVFGELVLRPNQKWTLRSDAHFLRLSSRNDLWYSGGGAFQTNTFGYVGRPGGARGLANLYDLSADYQVNEHVGLTGYYALATGRAVIETIYPQGSTGQLAYAELNWRF